MMFCCQMRRRTSPRLSDLPSFRGDGFPPPKRAAPHTLCVKTSSSAGGSIAIGILQGR